MNVKVLHYISLGEIYYSFVENDNDVTPADVLTFISGADQEPPLGFVSLQWFTCNCIYLFIAVKASQLL